MVKQARRIALVLIPLLCVLLPSAAKTGPSKLAPAQNVIALQPQVKNERVRAVETVFPSQNGTMPVTSPDGQWIAYIETGWGRPGGSGGFGRSNLISITHVVDINGKNDRVVSDMFLVGWMSDSKRIGTARDAFVAISDLDGNVLTEFGDPFAEIQSPDIQWTKADLRSQFGKSMPHQKRLVNSENFGFGEGGAFSPDGKWYGPLQDANGFFFLSADGQRLPIKLSVSRRPGEAAWSPDGRSVQISDGSDWLIVDTQTLSSHRISNLSDGGSSQRRWNPWSKDGTRLAFVRDGQVWVSDALGNAARQLTFDKTRKACPTFSRDGRSVAYRTWTPEKSQQYEGYGPTDLWVVDVTSTLTTRVTSPAKARIINFDWLDDHTLIVDRQEEHDVLRFGPKSSLRRISIVTPSKD